MADGPSLPVDVLQALALSAAVSAIRGRRRTEDADALLDESLALLERIVSLSQQMQPPTRGRSTVATGAPGAPVVDDPFPEVDGGSAPIDTLKQHMRRVSRDTDVTVLILGESGTGKERVARAIHRVSSRGRAPFVVVNCAGLSPTLVEDELFGHRRGAFTGAISEQPGPFERASGGTVFLDEVGELTPDLQMKLLRALQQRTVQRLGSVHETPFDVRVIAATNADLALATARGRFRQDLYYRLKVYELRVPPLRRRGATDLRELVGAILKRLGGRRQRPPATLDAAVWALFVCHRWPGNVRELENTLERMIVAAGDDPLLTPEHLPEDFGMLSRRAGHLAQLSSVVPAIAVPATTVPDLGATVPARATGLSRALPSASEVGAALERNRFASDATAAELGLSRHQLYRLVKRYDLRSLRVRR